MHVRPSQQSLPDAQVPSAGLQVGALVQVPPWQVRPSQHSPRPLHPAFAGWHAGAAHLPSVPQARPLAQSVPDVQAQPAGLAATAHGSALAAQMPPLQMPEQQSAAAEHVAPLVAQAGGFPPDDPDLHAGTKRNAAATSSPIRSDAKRMLASLLTWRPTMAQRGGFFH